MERCKHLVAAARHSLHHQGASKCTIPLLNSLGNAGKAQSCADGALQVHARCRWTLERLVALVEDAAPLLDALSLYSRGVYRYMHCILCGYIRMGETSAV
jgi:hypothetical protein